MEEFFTESIVLLFWSAVQAGQVKFFKANFYIIYPSWSCCMGRCTSTCVSSWRSELGIQTGLALSPLDNYSNYTVQCPSPPSPLHTHGSVVYISWFSSNLLLKCKVLPQNIKSGGTVTSCLVHFLLDQPVCVRALFGDMLCS